MKSQIRYTQYLLMGLVYNLLPFDKFFGVMVGALLTTYIMERLDERLKD